MSVPSQVFQDPPLPPLHGPRDAPAHPFPCTHWSPRSVSQLYPQPSRDPFYAASLLSASCHFQACTPSSTTLNHWRVFCVASCHPSCLYAEHLKVLLEASHPIFIQQCKCVDLTADQVPNHQSISSAAAPRHPPGEARHFLSLIFGIVCVGWFVCEFGFVFFAFYVHTSYCFLCHADGLIAG